MNISFDFADLLKNLGQKFEIDIDPKIEGGLVLKIDQKYPIQIEFLEDRIVLSSKVGEILVSRFRHQVFSDALKANLKSSCFGSLGYSDQQKMLLLILNYPILPPKEQEFFPMLDGFIAKTKEWTEALIAGNTRLLT